VDIFITEISFDNCDFKSFPVYIIDLIFNPIIYLPVYQIIIDLVEPFLEEGKFPLGL
jgi:hypothetical protein